MKPIITTNHEIYCKHRNGNLSVLNVEIEEYKNVYVAHIVDNSFLLRTIRFAKCAKHTRKFIVEYMYSVAQRYNYFN